MKKITLIAALLFNTYGNAKNAPCDATDISNHKVNVCHVPSGDMDKAFTICVDYDGAKTHLGIAMADKDTSVHDHKHHDFLGKCNQNKEQEELWMCNAGLKHTKHNYEHEYCYGSSCISTIDTNHNFENITYNIADYFSTDTFGNFTPQGIYASSTANFNESSSALGQHILSDVQFELHSERIGSEYFVDICWKTEEDFDSTTGFDIYNRIEAYNNGIPYIDMTSLKGRFELKCGQDFNSLGTVASSGMYTPVSDISSFSTQFYNPQFKSCVIRQYFQEQRIQGREQRLNKFKSITVSSKVTSTVEFPPQSDDKIKFCQVEEIGNGNNKIVQCFNNLLGNDSLRNFLGTRHQSAKDYSGPCSLGNVSGAKCQAIYQGNIE